MPIFVICYSWHWIGLELLGTYATLLQLFHIPFNVHIHSILFHKINKMLKNECQTEYLCTVENFKGGVRKGTKFFARSAAII